MRNLFLACLLAFPLNTFAEPKYFFKAEDVTITLHNDKCALKEITNPPWRAVWKKGNEVVEGCWGITSAGIVVMYFADKTVTALPGQAFERLTAT